MSHNVELTYLLAFNFLAWWGGGMFQTESQDILKWGQAEINTTGKPTLLHRRQHTRFIKVVNFALLSHESAPAFQWEGKLSQSRMESRHCFQESHLYKARKFWGPEGHCVASFKAGRLSNPWVFKPHYRKAERASF